MSEESGWEGEKVQQRNNQQSKKQKPKAKSTPGPEGTIDHPQKVTLTTNWQNFQLCLVSLLGHLPYIIWQVNDVTQ